MIYYVQCYVDRVLMICSGEYLVLAILPPFFKRLFIKNIVLGHITYVREYYTYH